MGSFLDAVDTHLVLLEVDSLESIQAEIVADVLLLPIRLVDLRAERSAAPIDCIE